MEKKKRIGRNKKVWLLILIEVCVILFIAAQLTPNEKQAAQLGSALQENFAVVLSDESMNCLYQKENRGWLGDGEGYSVWQVTDSQQLLQEIDWIEGAQPFQQQLFQEVVQSESLDVDRYYLPQDWEHEGYYYQTIDADGYGDDQLLLIFLPQGKLGDGLQYKNLLFVIERYS